MGGWYSYIAEYGMKSAKSIGKMFSGSGAKAAEQVAKVSKAELKQVAKVPKAELKQVADVKKANAAIKSIGSPKINVAGLDISRFSYKNGTFWDLKHANTFYSRKEFSQLQSHFNNLYKGGRTSGYKAWEKSLPKACFTPHFNPINPNTLKQESKIAGQGSKVAAKEAQRIGSGYKAWEKTLPKACFTPHFNPINPNTLKQESKIAGQGSKVAAKEAQRIGSNIGESVAKQKWYQNAENWKTAGRLGIRGMNKAGRGIQGTAEFGFRAARGAIKNAKGLAILAGTGWVAYNVYNGNGIVKPLMGAVGGKEAKQGGAVNLAEQLIAGDGASQLHDNLTGMVGGVMNEAGDVYYRLKDGTIAVVDEAGNLYQGGKEMITGTFNGNGMINDGNGYYSDPTAQQYPTMNQMMGQQGYGMANGLMGGMNNALNSVTNGNVSKLDLAGLLVSAYMMFGRFGWLGKAASLMLGGMTLKNINNHQSSQIQPTPQQQYGFGAIQSTTPAQRIKTMEQPVEDDENVIVRSRGI